MLCVIVKFKFIKRYTLYKFRAPACSRASPTLSHYQSGCPEYMHWTIEIWNR